MSKPGTSEKTENGSKRVRHIKRHRVKRRRSVNKGRNFALVVLVSMIALALMFALWWSYAHPGHWLSTTDIPWRDNR